jgi:hypothetical protein
MGQDIVFVFEDDTTPEVFEFGVPGPDGPTGATGPQGADGADGVGLIDWSQASIALTGPATSVVVAGRVHIFSGTYTFSRILDISGLSVGDTFAIQVPLDWNLPAIIAADASSFTFQGESYGPRLIPGDTIIYRVESAGNVEPVLGRNMNDGAVGAGLDIYTSVSGAVELDLSLPSNQIPQLNMSLSGNLALTTINVPRSRVLTFMFYHNGGARTASLEGTDLGLAGTADEVEFVTCYSLTGSSWEVLKSAIATTITI